MDLSTRGKIRDLLERAGVSDSAIDFADQSESMRTALEVAADMIGDRAPDVNWWREKFLISGEHMVLTDEGWIPASMNTAEICGEDGPCEVLDEVNAPDTPRVVVG